MTHSEIGTLTNIATKYSELKNSAAHAQRIVRDVKFKLFPNFITAEEIEVLNNAIAVLVKIQNNATQSDAIKCYIEYKND